MVRYPANRIQPNICLSLSTEWLSQMTLGEGQGQVWCARAHAAAPDDAFYQRHLQEQDELTGVSLMKQLRLQQAVLKAGFAQRYPAEAARMLEASRPVVDELANFTYTKVRLLRLRRMRVARGSYEGTSLEMVQSEFMRLDEVPRYYLVSVSVGTRGSHAIGVVSSKRQGRFSPGGHMYYYDPNLRSVVQLRSRSDLNDLLAAAVQGDYGPIGKIWELVRA
ncbi:hypothetical protein [Bordetella hinzii]|uniref:hypothetical protein n=1 Tax=Bordetella hinzii TaxID=103855 RepID=UPI0005190475|nr:hypothetical protein [Bordetella hinzii]QWF40089.1 hypothetical protein HHA25_18335 [Bordetella hinzii]QWF44634.1 hypothetical protein HHA24_18325 [Bordetella hinzii]QWF49171.1 hypothetical protein HHA23_18325 [Bordetella hinzii]QWF53707.1 hypothetical protein HHA22_18330 [Bordetella hinzii]QWF58197.1 hypothetical protein HHA21_18085 [Bordetella hinzii]